MLNDNNGEPRWPPGAHVISGNAGDCFINWCALHRAPISAAVPQRAGVQSPGTSSRRTMVYHTRTPSAASAPDRKLFWLVYRRSSQPNDKDYARKQDQISHAHFSRRRREWAEQGGMETRLALWSDLDHGSYGLDLLGDAEKHKELRRFAEGQPRL